MTHSSCASSTQTDYILVSNKDRKLVKEMKVIPSKGVASQHRIIVPDVTVKPCREEKQLLEKMKVNVFWKWWKH